ncbi:MAG: penicillin-binding protein 2 [Acidobacteriota bacterium]
MDRTDDPTFEPKVLFLQFVAAAVFVLFASRLFLLQVMEGSSYRTLSENNYTRTIVLRSPRGVIADRNGKVLCRNRISFSLVLDTAKEGSLERTVDSVNRILGLSMTLEEVRAAMKRSAVPSLAVLARDVPPDWVQKVEVHQDELKMLRIEMELRREYPYGPLGSHAIGYVGLLSEKEAETLRIRELDPFIEVGKAGVEKAANALLMGENGRRTAQVNAMGREVEDPRLRLPGVGVQREPVPGRNIRLNLDVELQQILTSAFGEETGAAVFMNPSNGEILAWVSVPDYDPNLFSHTISAKDWQALSEDPRHPLLNRPIQGAYPAGSTFKPFVALVGMEEGLLTPGTTFYCPGAWEFGGHVFHCWARGGHGGVDPLTAIQNSCNVFFYRAGDRVGIERLARWGALFGLGQRTGVDLPSETAGSMPSAEWKRARGLGPWYPGETLSVSIGQGYLTVTPLQLLSFYSTLATGGKRYQPRLLQGEPKLLSSVDVSASSLEVLKEGLQRVVTSGTGRACNIPGLTVCAKTGTAQVVAASAGVDTRLLDKAIRDHAWFAGFAPRQDPQVAFVVLVEHGGHGGDMGAKIARAGLEYLFFGKKPGDEAPATEPSAAPPLEARASTPAEGAG